MERTHLLFRSQEASEPNPGALPADKGVLFQSPVFSERTQIMSHMGDLCPSHFPQRKHM